MNIEQFKTFLNRYINSRSTQDETAVYDDFFETYQQRPSAAHSAGEQDRIRERIFAKIAVDTASKRRVISLPIMMRVAAALLVLAVTGIVVYHWQGNAGAAMQVVTVAAGRQQEVLLEEGTVVLMNAGSTLTYPSSFDGDNRVVNLEGEAFFKVKRDEHKPFIVRSGEINTTVLGTSFNIAAYKGDAASVTVVTGKVKVSAKNAGEVTLMPNQQAYMHKGALAIKMVAAADYVAWGDGTIYLKETPLPELVNKLERKYGADIQLAPGAAGSQCLFNGKLADDRLENVLENLKFMSKLQYRMINDTTVIIKSVSCK